MNQLLHHDFFAGRIHSVLSDRECPAIEKAQRHGVRVEILREKEKEQFSARVLDYLEEHRADYAISFYSKLFVGQLLNAYRDRIINLHPSLLPSFKGLHGFEDAIAHGVRYVGSTIHFIDENLDEGKIIQQTICPVDENEAVAVTRHRIFEQQCRSLLQVMKWIEDDRLVVAGKRIVVRGADFNDPEFSPGLDFNEAIALKIPKPDWLEGYARKRISP